MTVKHLSENLDIYALYRGLGPERCRNDAVVRDDKL